MRQWRLFRAMVIEEWRMHSHLFGSRRFLGFPLLIFSMSAAGVWGLTLLETEIDSIVLGIQTLVFAFGLYTGSIGLVGRDALRDLLGEMTLLVFSARTLPLSRRQLVGVFIIKDVAYYSGLFLLPVTLSMVAGTGVTNQTELLSIGPLFVSLVVLFAFGIAITVLSIGLTTRGHVGKVATGLIIGAAGASVFLFPAVLQWTPIVIYRSPISLNSLFSMGIVLTTIIAGIIAFDPGSQRTTRHAENTYVKWRSNLTWDRNGLIRTNILAANRSSGGLWKFFFSGAILFGVSFFLLRLVERLLGITPTAPLAYGGILSLTAFTTLNWLTQFDDISDYSALPLDVEDLFEAKFRTFLLIQPAVGFVFYAVALALPGRGVSIPGTVVGAIVLAGGSLYLYGLTVFLSGFEPNEFLFDTVLFALFTIAIGALLIPIVILSLLAGALDPWMLLAIATGSILAGGIGQQLHRRATRKWHHRYRQ